MSKKASEKPKKPKYETIRFPMVKGSRKIIKAHCRLIGEDYGWFLRRALIETMERDRKARLLAEGCCYGERIQIPFEYEPDEQPLQPFGKWLVEHQDYVSPDKLKQALRIGIHSLSDKPRKKDRPY